MNRDRDRDQDQDRDRDRDQDRDQDQDRNRSHGGDRGSHRVRLRVVGRVQGVGFRYFVLNAARRIGVVGWVRNDPDGSVRCEAQGELERVQEFCAALAEGPRSSQVDDVETEVLALLHLETDAGAGGFEIR